VGPPSEAPEERLRPVVVGAGPVGRVFRCLRGAIEALGGVTANLLTFGFRCLRGAIEAGVAESERERPRAFDASEERLRHSATWAVPSASRLFRCLRGAIEASSPRLR